MAKAILIRRDGFRKIIDISSPVDRINLPRFRGIPTEETFVIFDIKAHPRHGTIYLFREQIVPTSPRGASGSGGYQGLTATTVMLDEANNHLDNSIQNLYSYTSSDADFREPPF